MCGRFTLHHSTEQVAERFAVQQVLFPLEARYNVAPAQAVPVVANSPTPGVRWMEAMKWGLVPFWAKDPEIGNRLINARAETIAENIRTAVEIASFIHAPGLQCSISIGIAQPIRERGLRDWLEIADRALYRAKHAGRNRTESRDLSMEHKSAEVPL